MMTFGNSAAAIDPDAMAARTRLVAPINIS